MVLFEHKIPEIKVKMGSCIERIRPKPEIQDKLDISFKIHDQSVETFEIRETMDAGQIDSPIAKATFVRSENSWKVFWMRQDLKWHGYRQKLSRQFLNSLSWLKQTNTTASWDNILELQ